MTKLGIIAGSGELPRQVITAALEGNREVFVIAFEGITDEDTVKNIPHKWVHIGRVGLALNELRESGAKDLLLAGRVGRPSFSALNLDYSGIKLMVKLSRLPSQGDNEVFSAIIEFLEKSKFNVVGAEDVLASLLIQKGTLGKIEPNEQAQKDIEIGRNAALEIGKLDIGQAVITQGGQILGVEGAEGTDRLVKRCKELHAEGQGGVLIKMKKPDQDSRVDLPSIGVNTIENAHESGLCGIAVAAGGSLVINRKKVIERADKLGIFVVGI